jgi:type I restriction enzyme S subunit
MKLPPYPRYKPSGVEWLGDAPEHWEVKRLGRVIAKPLQYGANESAESEDPNLPRYVRITDVHENGSLRPDTFRSLPKDVAVPYLLDDGDLLFARSGATSGKTFLYQSSWGLCAFAGYLIRARMDQQKALPAFVKYFTTSTSYWQWLSSIFIQSTIQNVSAQKYADLQLSLPPLAEQRSITNFLNREIAKLDRLVANKLELIERLKEKRAALISRTVTRGLPPAAARAAGLPANPPLKPSGIDWLGEIPKHWELLMWRRLILSLKDFGSNGSFAGLRENVEYLHEPDFAQLIRLTDLRGDLEHEGAIYVSEESFKYLKHSSLKGGEFLIANVGAHAGLVLEMPKMDRPATLGPNMMFAKRIREDKVTTRYLILSAQSDLIRSQLTMIANASSAQPKLNKDDVRSVVTPLPPLPEQAAIAAYLDLETAKLEALVGKVGEAVERLQEYRTGLITAAVTGKIDVRANATNITP